MKRLTISVFAILLVLTILVLPVIAAEICGGFVDADQNGICDNRGSSENYVDEDHDGICDNRDRFSDTDNDGVCDFRDSAKCGRQCGHNGQGCGRQRRCGN